MWQRLMHEDPFRLVGLYEIPEESPDSNLNAGCPQIELDALQLQLQTLASTAQHAWQPVRLACPGTRLAHSRLL